jgi:parallel beta-helix repeat protein
MDSACSRDTVVVGCGTHYEHDIMVKWGVVLRGETGEPECAIIDAQGQGRVLVFEHMDDWYFASTPPEIEGLTLTGGSVAAHGGGMYLSYSSPVIHKCVISDNSTSGVGNDGGGVYCRYSAPVFNDCMIVGNTAFDDAGGVYCRDSSPATFENCIFANNSCLDKGGGLLCYNGSNPTVDSCTFYGNSAGSGGGIAAMTNSIVEVENTIIAFGTAGEAAYCDLAGSSIWAYCCDVYGNAGGDWVECIAGQGDTRGNFSEDPLFCEPDSLDFTLENASPCLDAPGCGLVGALGEGCGISGFPDDQVNRETFGLLANQPNPSSRATEIVFSLEVGGHVALEIYDARGRRIALLAAGRYEVGTHHLTWEGTDSSGRSVSPGVYFCRLEAGNRVANQRIVLVR